MLVQTQDETEKTTTADEKNGELRIFYWPSRYLSDPSDGRIITRPYFFRDGVQYVSDPSDGYIITVAKSVDEAKKQVLAQIDEDFAWDTSDRAEERVAEIKKDMKAEPSVLPLSYAFLIYG